MKRRKTLAAALATVVVVIGGGAGFGLALANIGEAPQHQLQPTEIIQVVAPIK